MAKPFFVIYDPSTVKNRDVMALVRARVNDAQVGMQKDFEECKNPLDAFNMARDCEIGQYSAFVVVGDDTTFHDAVNGMLAREDGKKIAIGLVPASAETNDLCLSLGNSTIDQALDTIVSGWATPIDTTRVTLDHELDEELPEGKKLDYCRHMLSSSSLSIPAQI